MSCIRVCQIDIKDGCYNNIFIFDSILTKENTYELLTVH